MTAPADIQTKNFGSKAGRPEEKDTVTYTYADTVNPGAILAGWDGSAVTVNLHIEENDKNDLMAVRDTGGRVLFELGLVELKGDYAKSNLNFTASRMTVSGRTVTIVLRNQNGQSKHTPKSAAMVWWTTKGNATESGPADAEF